MNVSRLRRVAGLSLLGRLRPLAARLARLARPQKQSAVCFRIVENSKTKFQQPGDGGDTLHAPDEPSTRQHDAAAQMARSTQVSKRSSGGPSLWAEFGCQFVSDLITCARERQARAESGERI